MNFKPFQEKVWLSSPTMHGEELNYIEEAYRTNWMSTIGENINQIASRRDGKNTLHYCLVYFLLGPITCEIFSIVWLHSLSNRIGDEARARGIATDFGASTYWLWNVLGSLIIVGPFIYLHKLCKTMNALCENYNRMGI